MKAIRLAISDVLLPDPEVCGDDWDYFCASSNLSAENKTQMWIPEGFAHGFVVLTNAAEVLYKTTDYWAPEHERCIAWNDETLAINWAIYGEPVLSRKDAQGNLFAEAETFS